MRHIIKRLIPLSILFGLVIGCASAPKEEKSKEDIHAKYRALKSSIENSNKISPGYRLELRHSSDSVISGKYRVAFNGKIKLPYKITLTAAGLTTSQLSKKISKAYKKFFKGPSKIKVKIFEKTYLVEVRGDVKKPGRYSVQVDTKLEELIAKAGGFTGSSNAEETISSSSRPEFLRIERPNYGQQAAYPKISWFRLAEYFYHYQNEPDFLWRGGEGLVFQQTAPANANINSKWATVTVMGAVRNPQEHPVLHNADVLTYLSRSGGPSDTADLANIEIIHRADDDQDTITLSSAAAYRDIRPGDVIVVRSVDARPSTLDRILSYTQIISGVALSVFLVLLL